MREDREVNLPYEDRLDRGAQKIYGETIYENMAQTVLTKRYDLEIINVGTKSLKNMCIPKFSYAFAG